MRKFSANSELCFGYKAGQSLLVFGTAIAGIEKGFGVASVEAEAEDFMAGSIKFFDQAVVFARLVAGNAPAGHISRINNLEGTAGLCEVHFAGRKDVAATQHFTGLGVDGEAQQTGVGYRLSARACMSVAVVEDGQRVVVVQGDIVLSEESVFGIKTGSVDAPHHAAVRPVDFQHGADCTEGAE